LEDFFVYLVSRLLFFTSFAFILSYVVTVLFLWFWWKTFCYYLCGSGIPYDHNFLALCHRP